MRKRDGKKPIKIRTPYKSEEAFLPSENAQQELTEEQVKEIIEKQESDQVQLDEAEQQVANQNSKNKKILNLIFFLINIGVVVGILVYQLSAQEVMPISALFSSGLNFWYLLLTLVVFGLSMLFETIRVNILIKRTSGRSRPFLSYKSVGLCRHYDVITPMATGGEPFQIMYLKNRGLKDILILCADGLTGMKEAVTTAFPKTEYQRCIVHQVRNTLKYVGDKDKKIVINETSIFNAKPT